MSAKRFGFRRVTVAVAIIVIVTPLFILGVYALGGASSGDREKRIHELQVTQPASTKWSRRPKPGLKRSGKFT